MNRLCLFLFGAVALATLLTPAGSAKAANYCLAGDLEQCHFVSLEQCLAAASGNGGFCLQDSNDLTPAPRVRPRRR
jgi:hypothetical protein